MSLDRRAILRGLGAAEAAGSRACLPRAGQPGAARATAAPGRPAAHERVTSRACGLPPGSRPGPEGAPDA